MKRSDELNEEQRELAQNNLGLAYAAVHDFLGGEENYRNEDVFIDREELMSEAVSVLCQATKWYDPTRARFSTFATTCIRRRFISLLRRRQSRLLASTSRMSDPTCRRGSPEMEAQLRELPRLVDRLPSRLAEPVRLVHLRGLSIQRAAQELSTSRTTVEHRLRLALEALRRALDPGENG